MRDAMTDVWAWYRVSEWRVLVGDVSPLIGWMGKANAERGMVWVARRVEELVGEIRAWSE